MSSTIAISEPETLPAPILEPWTPPQTPTPVPRDPKWEQEYQAFQKLLPELLKTLHGQYVAVHNGQVVASGAEQLAVAKRAWERVGYVAIHVGLVTEEPPRVYRLPSPRVIGPVPSP